MASEGLQREGVWEVQRRIRSISAAGNKNEAVRIGRAAVERLLGAAESSTVDRTQKDQIIAQAELLMTEISKIQRNPNEPSKFILPLHIRSSILIDSRRNSQRAKV